MCKEQDLQPSRGTFARISSTVKLATRTNRPGIMSQSGSHSSDPEKDSNGPVAEPTTPDANVRAQGERLMRGPALVIVITGLAPAAFLITLDTLIVAAVRSQTSPSL